MHCDQNRLPKEDGPSWPCILCMDGWMDEWIDGSWDNTSMSNSGINADRDFTYCQRKTMCINLFVNRKQIEYDAE